MKRVFPVLFCFLAAGFVLQSCFKSHSQKFQLLHPSASRMAGIRTWQGHLTTFTGSNTVIDSLPDSTFGIIVINDSTVRLPGSGPYSSFDLKFDPYRSYGQLEEYHGAQGAYNASVRYTAGTDSIGLWLHQDLGGFDYYEYYFLTH
jgi:hypothetical protein